SVAHHHLGDQVHAAAGHRAPSAGSTVAHWRPALGYGLWAMGKRPGACAVVDKERAESSLGGSLVKRTVTLCMALVLIVGVTVRLSAQPTQAAKPTEKMASAAKAEPGWIPLFDGKSLDNWKASDDPASFAVEDSTIVVNAKGGPSHLFYVGPVQNH